MQGDRFIISQADLLPSRADFIFEMDLILRGTIQTTLQDKQTDLFGIEIEEDDVMNQVVNLDRLCEMFPRLALVRKSLFRIFTKEKKGSKIREKEKR